MIIIAHSRPSIGEEEKKASAQVLDSGHLAQGPKVETFERLFCEKLGRKFAIAVNSGSSALYLALRALGLHQEDEVICPSYTCVAILHAIHQAGAQAVLADIDPEDFNISLTSLKSRVTQKTKALIVPHALGRAARMTEILGLGIPVIEDATQALGASVGGEPAGCFGMISLFSFYATKMITTGEGGMLLTDAQALAEKIYDWRDYDKKENYDLRANFKMTDLGAAIGIEQLKKLPLFLEKRREIAGRYGRLFEGGDIETPVRGEGRDHVFYRYVIRVPAEAGKFIQFFESGGICVKRPVFKPLHAYCGRPDREFPATSQAFQQAVSLPVYPSLSPEEWDQISDVISKWNRSLPGRKRFVKVH